MSDSSESRDVLDELGEEFLGRLRRGERPAVSEFAAPDPGRAGEIREFLSALLFVEGVKPQFALSRATARPGLDGPGPRLERLGDFRVLRELGRGGWASSTRPSRSRSAGSWR